MATIVDITVGPSGRDFTTVTAALASVNSNLVTADEQVNIIIDEQVGGYLEFVTVPTITQSATQYLHIQAAQGSEYNPVTNTGVYFSASRAFSAVFTNTQNFTRISNVGARNTRTLTAARGIDNFGDNCQLTNVYGFSASSTSSMVFFFNNANGLIASNLLSVGGSTGFDFGNNGTRTVDKITAANATSVGIDTGTAQTTLTNSLTIGSSNPYLGTFNAASSNNAGDGTDTPGANPQNNRTTADFVDFANDDFRTASSSALATAGVGGTFIGYALESGGGEAVVVDEITSNTESTSNNPIVTTVGPVIIAEEVSNTGSTALNPTIVLTTPVVVNESLSDTESESNDPAVLTVGPVQVVEQLSNTDSSSLNPVIILNAEIVVDETTSNTNSESNNPQIFLTAEVTVNEVVSNTESEPLSPTILLSTPIQVMEQASNTDSSSLDPIVSLVGPVDVLENTSDTGSESLDPTIIVTAPIVVNESTSDTESESLSPTITLGAQIVVNEVTSNTGSSSLNPDIELSGSVTVLESTSNTSSTSLNPTISVGQIVRIENIAISYKQNDIILNYKANDITISYKGN